MSIVGIMCDMLIYEYNRVRFGTHDNHTGLIMTLMTTTFRERMIYVAPRK